MGSDGGLAERLAAVGDNLQLADVVLGVVRSHFLCVRRVCGWAPLPLLTLGVCSNNTAAGAGGAVTADLEHSMNFTECELAFNSAMRGAAVNVMSVIAGTFVKLHLHDNVASEEGGGLLIRGGFATCVDCVVRLPSPCTGATSWPFGRWGLLIVWLCVSARRWSAIRPPRWVAVCTWAHRRTSTGKVVWWTPTPLCLAVVWPACLL